MKLTLVKKVDEAKGTKTFIFKPEKPVSYVAGQYFYITLLKLNYPDARGATRHFTLSSSPTEGELMTVTTRIRQESGFKKTLDELKIGDQVEGEGPNGTFVLDENSNEPNVFLAGGIGITPFRSMIKNVTDKNLNVPIYLIFSNSNEEDIAFKKELEQTSKAHPNIKVNFVVTNKTSRLDATSLQKILEDWSLELLEVLFWVVGPPPMVDAIEQILESLKVSSNNIRIEKFTGY